MCGVSVENAEPPLSRTAAHLDSLRVVKIRARGQPLRVQPGEHGRRIGVARRVPRVAGPLRREVPPGRRRDGRQVLRLGLSKPLAPARQPTHCMSKMTVSSGKPAAWSSLTCASASDCTSDSFHLDQEMPIQWLRCQKGRCAGCH